MPCLLDNGASAYSFALSAASAHADQSQWSPIS